MALQNIRAETVAFRSDKSLLTRGQRYMLRRFHPSAIFVDVVAILWATYFFWNHHWLATIAVVVVGRLLGTTLSQRLNYEPFARTVWGKLALLHLHPANVGTQTLGAVVYFYGLWIHGTVAILSGVSLILLGHLFGWSKMLPSLSIGEAK